MPFEPSRYPFDRYGVFAVRLKMGSICEDRFYVMEFDLGKDDLGLRRPSPRSELEARSRLADLGLDEAEIDARLSWARQRITTRTFRP